MTGDTANYEHRGIAPRCLGQIFSEINARVEYEYRVSCTYSEIYNEKFFDLLADLSRPDHVSDFAIIEERDGRGVFVRGLTEVDIKSETEALNLLFSGELARTTATHKLNRKSNRSHSIFTVYLQQRLRSGVSERVVHSKLHLIDLAGSERLKKTLGPTDGLTGEDVTRKESMQINQSLTYLEQCVVALARKSAHIPFRQSKLTNILKDCLGANCNTLMIACIWGESTHLEETVSTLRLASRMMHVTNETVSVETVDPNALIKKQAKLIKALKQELLMHDALVERTGMTYEPYTPEQQNNIAQMLERYVASAEAEEEEVLSISSYRQMLEICKQFKRMVLGARAETAAAREEAMLGGGTFADGRLSPEGARLGTAADYAAEHRIADEFDPKAPYVGEAVGPAGSTGGFALGTSAQDSRPAGGVEGIARFAAAARMGDAGATSASLAMGSASSPLKASGRSTKFDDSAAARGGAAGINFTLPGGAGNALMDESGGGGGMDGFVQGDGRQLYEVFSMHKTQLKELKNRCRDSSAAVNDAKAAIDRLQAELEARKTSRIELLRRSGLKASETEDIVDEEEFQLMKELRETKRAYKNGYEQLQRAKAAASQVSAALDNAKAELAHAFSAWSASGGGGGSFHRGLSSPMPGHSMGGPGGATDKDGELDDQEMFDRLEEERVMASDPDSMAFFHANKTKKAVMTQNFVSLRQMQRNKRAL